MKIDIEGIEKFLSDNARVQAHAVLATAAARPLLEAIAAGMPLIRSAEEVVCEGPIRLGMVLDAVGWFRPGTDVETETVSLALPPGMTESRWIEERWGAIEQRLRYGSDQGRRVPESGGQPFLEIVEAELFRHWSYAGRYAGLAEDGFKSLLGRMRECCPTDAVWRCLPPHLCQPVLQLDATVIWSLLLLFSRALLDDAAELERAAKFVRLLEKTVPLGHDVRGRWLLPVL